MNASPNTPVHASLLRIEGEDATNFAQAQFTSDVRTLEPHMWQWSAWLDARGRVQHLFHLARIDEQQYILLLRGGDAQAMAERLRHFVLRSRVRLDALPPASLGSGKPMAAYHAESDGDALALGLGDRGLAVPATDSSDWRLQAIIHGEPWLPDSLAGVFLPPALGLRRLGALSFDKGCFPGQEVAARLHYRGGHKYVLAHLRLRETVAAGSTVTPDPLAEGGDNERSLRILDCVCGAHGVDALAVMHERMPASLSSQDPSSTKYPFIVQIFKP